MGNRTKMLHAKHLATMGPKTLHGLTHDGGFERSGIARKVGALGDGAATRSGLARFERELVRARTSQGRERAKAPGVKLGKKSKLTDHQKRAGRSSGAIGSRRHLQKLATATA